MKTMIIPVDYYPTWELVEADGVTSQYDVFFDVDDMTYKFIRESIENYKKAQFILGKIVGKDDNA